MGNIILHQTVTGWEFISEVALENFIWEHLTSLLHLTPLKRQYSSGGEICDILAVDEQRGLVILELKNAEDRYLIQQLTRYYANLLAEQPFATTIDYARPIRLIAIAPTYHRHNLIDRDYSQLPIELWQFSIVQEQPQFYFQLQEVGQTTVQRHLIPYCETVSPARDHIPDPPQLLRQWLGGCTSAEQAGFLSVRERLLASSERMKERLSDQSIEYGSRKTRLCAEICFHRQSQRPILFLWLPTPGTYVWREVKPPVIGRLRIWTDGERISHVGHVADGFGKMKLRSEWEQMPVAKRPKALTWSLSSRSHLPTEVEHYLRGVLSEDHSDIWGVLADLAIAHWFEKH